jgi:hypothetical protein
MRLNARTLSNCRALFAAYWTALQLGVRLLVPPAAAHEVSQKGPAERLVLALLDAQGAEYTVKV